MNDKNVISLLADATITAHTNVRLTASGTVEPAAAASKAVIGTALADAADGDAVSIALFNAFPVHFMTASGAISLGAAVKLDDDGKIQDYGGTGTAIGNTLQAATADGDIIRVLCIGSTLSIDDAAAAS